MSTLRSRFDQDDPARAARLHPPRYTFQLAKESRRLQRKAARKRGRILDR
jgi:hypothetical protein